MKKANYVVTRKIYTGDWPKASELHADVSVRKRVSGKFVKEAI